MNNTPDLVQKLAELNDRIQELKSINTPGGFTGNAVLFGGTDGKITHDATNFIWNNTTKRLGVGINVPLASLHVKFTGGSAIGARVEQVSASGDTLLDLFSSDSSITSASNFVLGRTASTILAQIRGDGAILSTHSVNVGAIGADLIYAQGTIGTAKARVATADGNAHVYVWAGQAGVLAGAGGIGFNWRQASGAAMGRQDTGTGGSYLRLLSNQLDANAVTTAGVVVPVQIWSSVGGAAATGFLGAAAAIRQTSGANLTNNVTSGGTNDQIDNWTNLTTYSTDAAAIRNAVYQLARKVKQLNDGVRTLGLFT